jgi:hypothetical protein
MSETKTCLTHKRVRDLFFSSTFSAVYKFLHFCCKPDMPAHLLFDVSFGFLFLLMLCRSAVMLLLYQRQPGNLGLGSWDMNDDTRSFFKLLV